MGLTIAGYFALFTTLLVTTVASATQWRVVEKITYDWGGNNKPYEFILRAPSDYDAGGDYTQLQIIREGKILIEVSDGIGLAEFDNKTLHMRNLLKSKHLLMLSSLKGTSKHPILLLSGHAYGSSPGSLHVVALGDDEIPKEILNLDHFEIESFSDLDKDRIPELVGYPCFSQLWGPDNCLQTYDPFHVYRFGDSATSAMKIDLLLTESYNRKNYYGWAGPGCSEDIAVVLRPVGGGNPVIMEAPKAKALCPTASGTPSPQ